MTMSPGPKPRSLESRLMARRLVTSSDCWEWLGAKSLRGYGRFEVAGKLLLPHRVAYELWRSPIPPGLVIDHLCSNPACFNPTHLESVTPAENVRRSRGPASRTHCPNGHPFSVETTTFTRQNHGRHAARICRICRRDRARQKRRERQGASI